MVSKLLLSAVGQKPNQVPHVRMSNTDRGGARQDEHKSVEIRIKKAANNIDRQ